MSDLADALNIRDLVLPVIRDRGRPAGPSILSQGVPMLTMRAGESRVRLSGPFRLDGAGLPEAVTAARPGPPLHRLTVHARVAWHFGPTLVIDWAEEATPTVHRFVRGPWEAQILDALTALPSSPTIHGDTP